MRSVQMMASVRPSLDSEAQAQRQTMVDLISCRPQGSCICIPQRDEPTSITPVAGHSNPSFPAHLQRINKRLSKWLAGHAATCASQFSLFGGFPAPLGWCGEILATIGASPVVTKFGEWKRTAVKCHVSWEGTNSSADRATRTVLSAPMPQCADGHSGWPSPGPQRALSYTYMVYLVDYPV
ncbi:hypothetical protein LZ30DRAFT_85087 [Colletotrichum cereale]|nr:hypothetical protein LZ30DRAFT_85087 [Colletotrichum cereale]